jgi:hypothetical protein
LCGGLSSGVAGGPGNLQIEAAGQCIEIEHFSYEVQTFFFSSLNLK